MTNGRMEIPLAVMGIGKLGAISRVLLARAGSVLIYASLCKLLPKGNCRWSNFEHSGIGKRRSVNNRWQRTRCPIDKTSCFELPIRH